MAFLDVVIQDLHKSYSNLNFDDLNSFVRKCKIWEFDWGIIYANKNDIHIHILSDYRKKVFLRKAFREVYEDIFSHYPYIKTTLLNTETDALKFDLKIGFKVVGKSDTCTFLEMKKDEFRYI